MARGENNEGTKKILDDYILSGIVLMIVGTEILILCLYSRSRTN